MCNYIPGVWICKGKCHGIVMDNINKFITQSPIDNAVKDPQSIFNSPIFPNQQTPLPQPVIIAP